MKKIAHIVSVSTSGENGFRWKWKSSTGELCAVSFEYYHACVEDARKAGYDVHLSGTAAQNVDGTPRTAGQ